MKAKGFETGGLQIERKLGEELYMVVHGEQVRIQIRELSAGKVVLGLQADPKKVAFVRGEKMRKK